MRKKVIIHFGPPKTGTSAIQNWLSENRKALQEKGFYYPYHSRDENSISPGHLNNLFDRKQGPSIELNKNKVKRLLNDFDESGCNTLLLSSEFFSNKINELKTAFTNAVFIGYIRNPLDLIESQYNQSVKRSKNAKKIKLPKKLPVKALNAIARAVKSIGKESFILRPYEKVLFKNEDIVSDFLFYVGISGLQVEKSERINTSYCFEALEFMRWVNGFAINNKLINRLDKELQLMHLGIRSYTLIRKNVYDKYKLQAAEALSEFYALTEFIQGRELISIVNNKKIKENVEQKLYMAHVNFVASYMIEKNECLYNELFKFLCALKCKGRVNRELVHEFLRVGLKFNFSFYYFARFYRYIFNGISDLSPINLSSQS